MLEVGWWRATPASRHGCTACFFSDKGGLRPFCKKLPLLQPRETVSSVHHTDFCVRLTLIWKINRTSQTIKQTSTLIIECFQKVLHWHLTCQSAGQNLWTCCSLSEQQHRFQQRWPAGPARGPAIFNAVVWISVSPREGAQSQMWPSTVGVVLTKTWQGGHNRSEAGEGQSALVCSGWRSWQEGCLSGLQRISNHMVELLFTIQSPLSHSRWPGL